MADSSSDSDVDEEIAAEIQKSYLEELEIKRAHPERLHEELWFNETGEVRALGSDLKSVNKIHCLWVVTISWYEFSSTALTSPFNF